MFVWWFWPNFCPISFRWDAEVTGESQLGLALAARQASQICRSSDSNCEASSVDSTRRAAWTWKFYPKDEKQFTQWKNLLLIFVVWWLQHFDLLLLLILRCFFASSRRPKTISTARAAAVSKLGASSWKSIQIWSWHVVTGGKPDSPHPASFFGACPLGNTQE